MFRFRRYRVFLICAFVITVLLYHVSKNSEWERSHEIWHTRKPAQPGAKPEPRPPPPLKPVEKPVERPVSPPPPVADDDDDDDDDTATLGRPAGAEVKIPQLKPDNEVKDGYALPTKVPPLPVKQHNVGDTEQDDDEPTATKPAMIPDYKPGAGYQGEKGQGKAIGGGINYNGVGGPLAPTPTTTIHWTKPSEWFPVPEESIIKLPTGKPKPIPSIQAKFREETPEAKEKRQLRLSKVKAEAERAWAGYKKYAWTHDELTPVTKQSKDPFCGWAATLVDSLDTLWIMGLKDEFDDAVTAVAEIDFTTTPYRSDIPVFETIIRYLGGLVAAYDVTGGPSGKYKVLLDKAVELAEILMSVFDTPNRMPILYYQWKPAFNIGPKRASIDSGVAEMGSMSMEFTRLAQLTGQHKYYDAIARITNAFEELQNRPNGTAIPGVFPQHLDASGCNRTAPAPSSLESSTPESSSLERITAAVQKQEALSKQYEPRGSDDMAAAESGEGVIFNSGSEILNKRDLGETEEEAEDIRPRNVTLREQEAKKATASAATSKTSKPKEFPPGWECAEQPLVGGGWGQGSYSMGGSQDSTYEYFPKQYLLLGGLEQKYRTMYEKTVAGVKKYLLFRPMAEGDPDILFSAKAYSADGTAEKLSYEWEVTHLTCFLGGMFGLGGKIFNSPEDVEYGKKLAEGCYWAYDVMPTGIMPENSYVLPCKNPEDCHFNKTAWYDALDTNAKYRAGDMERYYESKIEWKKEVEDIKKQQVLQKQAEERRQKAAAEKKALEIEERAKKRPANETTPAGGAKKPESFPSRFQSRSGEETIEERDPGSSTTLEDSLDLNTEYTQQQELIIPPEPVKPLTHMEYVQNRLEKEHIPPGFVTLQDKRYILRPEAIESVWYMYRITGDPSWQEKGWRMFEAVIKYTSTQVGHTAIRDVTDTTTEQEDSMESFWLAETLKYFYLLFAEPDVISLDDWVLNTEAHPFRRPT
ncbi:glycoside hydrolase [Podospora australis]|uniref:alpha-1,2-Mannosidase n=1 Tax=Podospora australis TaxID=1536484 RepID=A0AAN7AN72_9PEZI|nr:glycoside hydrolase [Podospora australis]